MPMQRIEMTKKSGGGNGWEWNNREKTRETIE
jgi:hypothetical protein